MTFTTRPTLQRHLRHGVLDPLARQSQSAMGVLERGGQRLRRRGRRRVRPARRRAAPERPGRRGAGHRRHRRRPDDRRCCAGRGRRRPAPPSRTSGPSGWTSSRVPGRSRRPCPARWTPGCCCCATTARCTLREVLEPAIGYAARRAPAGGAGSVTRSAAVPELFEEHWPTSAALWLRGRRGRRPRGSCSPTRRTPTPCALVAEAEAAGADREAQIEAARRRAGARASSPRRSTRSAGGRSGTPAAATHAGLVTGDDLAGLLGELGGAGHPRLARLLGRQDRPRGARARCCCSRWPCSTSSVTRRVDPDTAAGVHAVRSRC